MTLVAIITVRKDAIEKFRSYESHAARIMKEHGGRIERVIVAADTADTIKEIHVVTFPDDAAFKAYRQDPKLAEFAPLRDASVVGTDIHIGADGPPYG